LTAIQERRAQRSGEMHSCSICSDKRRCRGGDPDQVDEMKPLPTCLTRDEAQFINAAFARILSGNESVPTIQPSSGVPQMATLYRAGIAAVQAYCLRENRTRFQALASWQQDAVLALLEDGDGRAAFGQFKALFFLMVNDAAEAYFDQAWFARERGEVGTPLPEGTCEQHQVRAADDHEEAPRGKLEPRSGGK
jgi:hypothetical protein